jgi:inward rectifier potassium channel
MAREVKKKVSSVELGFGAFTTTNDQRLVDKDGNSNIQKVGFPFWRPYEVFQKLISMSWSKFLGLVLLTFTIANLLFAELYVWVGLKNLQGALTHSYWQGYWEAFFFSTQTMSTVGYGRISPVGPWASGLSAIESLIGLLVFALTTGLLYGRFSKPQLRLKYSDIALISPFLEGKGLMFKIANGRNTDLLDVEVSLIISFNELKNGKYSRQFYPVNLERKYIPILSMTWTLVHPIDESSPLYGKSYEDYSSSNLEVLILIKAYDPSFSQTVHSRSSYMYHEIVFDARFKPTIGNDDKGRILVDLSKLSSYEKISTI